MPRRREPIKRPARKRPAPKRSATQRARAQEQQYASQGRAVETQANQQRAAARPRPETSLTPAFRAPTSSRRVGIGPSVVRTRRAAKRAAARMPDHPAIPSIPLKRTYTQAERNAIRDMYRQAGEKAGVDSIRELYRLGSLRQRHNMREVSRVVAAEDASSPMGRALAERNERDGQLRARVPRSAAGQMLATARSDFLQRATVPGTRKTIVDLAGPKGALAPASVLFNLGRATVEDPEAVARSSVRTAIESIAGIPEGVKIIAPAAWKALPITNGGTRELGDVLKQIGEDYERRYGPIVSDPAQFREQVKKDYGLTPFMFDAASVGAGTGVALGGLARTGIAGRAMHALMTDERPALRFSAGEGGARKQQLSRNLFTAGAQRGLDRSRRRAFTKRVEAAGLREGPDGRIIEPEAGGGRLPALRPGAGEVLPKTTGVVGRSVRELPGLRSMTGRVARDVGGAQSVTRLQMLTTRGRVVAEIQKRIKQLTPEEQKALKYMEQLGVRSGPAGVRALERRLQQMLRGRERAGMERVAPVLADTNDEVRILREILADPDRHLTPEADAIADELRDLQLEHAARDPDLSPDRELIARLTPQGAALGVIRGPDVDYFRGVLRQIEDKTEMPGLAARADELASLPPAERAAAAKQLVKAARGDRKTAERAVATLNERLAVETEKLATRERFGPGEITGYRVRHGETRNRFDTREEAEAYADSIGGLPSDVVEIRKLDRGAGLFNGRQVDQARAREEHVALERAAADATLDRARHAEKALKEVLKASKSKRHMRLEGATQFAAKVRAAADEAGLAEPAYWESAMRPPGSTASLAATGRGLRATNRSKHRTGAIFDVGAEETSPDVFVRGVERNIKRRFQWSLVQRNLETHAFEWSRGRQGEGLTGKQLAKIFDERRIDPRSVDLINANFMRRRDSDPDASARGDTIDDVEPGLDDELGDQLTSTGDAQAELAAARRRLVDVIAEEQGGQAMNRYLVVPKDVADTAAATLRAMDNTAWRALEIVLKQKPARILLGAANVPWLSFQIASNALLTGLGGGVNPFNVHGAHKWWKSLEPDERDAVEAELGITHGHHMVGQDEPNLGATNARMVNFWRAYKKSRVGRLGTRVNPLNVMFRADEAQNNFFRKVLFYDAARKQAYRRMGQSWKANDRLISRLTDRVLAKPPGEMAQLIARHSEDFEKVARHTNEFLGDYLRFSPAERFLLSRNVMFYGYLRFSLRFTFYTMPVKHPVMANVMGNIGRMGAQEIKDLFGVPDDYQLPTSMLAQVYFGDRSDAQTGQLRSLPLGRFNPFLNSVTQLDGMQQAVGLVSPIYQAFVDQAFEESSFTGRDWRIEGRPTPSEAERPKNYYGSAWSMFKPAIPGVTEGSPRGRILQSSLLGLAYPYRTAERLLLEPNQSDDALLWVPKPMGYADPTAAAGVESSRQRQRDTPLQERLADQIIPGAGALFGGEAGQINAAPQVIQREREKEAAAEERAKRKPGERKRRKKKPTYGGGYGSSSSSAGSSYGGSSSSLASRYGG